MTVERCQEFDPSHSEIFWKVNGLYIDVSNGLPPVTDLCTPGAPAASSMQFMRCDNTALLLCIAISWHLAMSYNVPSRPLLWIILAPPGCSVSTWCWLGASCPEMIKFVFLVIVTLSGYFWSCSHFVFVDLDRMFWKMLWNVMKRYNIPWTSISMLENWCVFTRGCLCFFDEEKHFLNSVFLMNLLIWLKIFKIL